MGLDSVELVMEVEKHFSIFIPDSEAEKAYTVGKLVDCVAKIKGIERYDFSLRLETFSKIKKALLGLDPSLSDFSINNLVTKTLNYDCKPLLLELESKIGLRLPGIDLETNDETGFWAKLKKWFHFIEITDFERISWKKYTDILLAFNFEKLSPPIQYNSKYEIYIAIMRITVDKIGVSYSEIGIEKSFTDDLGVD